MKEKNKKEVKNVDILSYVKVGLLGVLAIATVVNVIFTVKYLPIIAKNTKGTTVNTDTTKEEPAAEYDVSKYNAVDLAGLKNVVKANGYQVIYIGRSTCHYCVQFLPIMTEAQEVYGFKTTYFDITKVINFETGAIADEAGYKYITDINSFFKDNFGSTPMVAIFKDGKFVKGTVGYTDLATYSKFLEDNGIKK